MLINTLPLKPQLLLDHMNNGYCILWTRADSAYSRILDLVFLFALLYILATVKRDSDIVLYGEIDSLKDLAIEFSTS